MLRRIAGTQNARRAPLSALQNRRPGSAAARRRCPRRGSTRLLETRLALRRFGETRRLCSRRYRGPSSRPVESGGVTPHSPRDPSIAAKSLARFTPRLVGTSRSRSWRAAGGAKWKRARHLGRGRKTFFHPKRDPAALQRLRFPSRPVVDILHRRPAPLGSTKIPDHRRSRSTRTAVHPSRGAKDSKSCRSDAAAEEMHQIPRWS